MQASALQGAGLGFRRELIESLKSGVPKEIEFFELAPENWAGMGGKSARDLRYFTERYPFVCHGLSLSLGGIAPLDETLLRRIKAFMAESDIPQIGVDIFTPDFVGLANALYNLGRAFRHVRVHSHFVGVCLQPFLRLGQHVDRFDSNQ